MVAYEMHWEDKEGSEHLLGVLLERRKNPQRITEESISKWARAIVGEWVRIDNIRFRQLEV